MLTAWKAPGAETNPTSLSRPLPSHSVDLSLLFPSARLHCFKDLFALSFYVHARRCLHVLCAAWLMSERQEEDSRSPGTGAIDYCEPLCGC